MLPNLKIAVFVVFCAAMVLQTDGQRTTPAPTRTTPSLQFPTVQTPQKIEDPTTPRTTPVRSTPDTSSARTTPVRLTQQPANNDASAQLTTPNSNNVNNGNNDPLTPAPNFTAATFPLTPAFNALQTPAFNASLTPAPNALQTPAPNASQTPAPNASQTPAPNALQTPAPGASSPNNVVGQNTPIQVLNATTLIIATPPINSSPLSQTPFVNSTPTTLAAIPGPAFPQTPTASTSASTTTPRTTPANTTPRSSVSVPVTSVVVPTITPAAASTTALVTSVVSTLTPALSTALSSATTTTSQPSTTFNIGITTMIPLATITTTTTSTTTTTTKAFVNTPTVTPINLISSTLFTLTTMSPQPFTPPPTVPTIPIIPTLPPMPTMFTMGPTNFNTAPFTALPPANSIAQDVNSANVNIVLMFCNMYTYPSTTNDQYVIQLRNQIANYIGNGFDQYRIAQITLSSNPDSGQMVAEFVIRPGLPSNPNPPNDYIIQKLKEKSFSIVDLNGNKLATNCELSSVIPWTEYWSCPNRKCENGGSCRVNNAGRYSCICKSGYVGNYCDINLWPLLCLPIIFFLAALTTLFLCLYLRRRKRRLGTAFKGFKSITTISDTTKTSNTTDNTTDSKADPPPSTAANDKKKVDSESPVKVKPSPKPLQTFYLPYNKPLTVGFSDVQFNDINADNSGSNPPQFIADRGAISKTGASLYGGGNAVASIYGGRSILTQPIEDPDIYYQTMGQKMALAYNDYTFVPTGRISTAGSVVFHGQNRGSNGGNIYNTVGNNVTATMSSRDHDDDVANDGTGYYHALGQKLAITFND